VAPDAGPVWIVLDPARVWLLRAVFWFGFALLLVATFLINHSSCSACARCSCASRPRAAQAQFRTPLFYRYVRHPIYSGSCSASGRLQ